MRNCKVNCFTFDRNTLQSYNDNLCLFRALALHLHGNVKLEQQTPKSFTIFFKNTEEGVVSNFQGVHLNEILKIEDLLQLNIFLFNIDFEVGELIGELRRRGFQK